MRKLFILLSFFLTLSLSGQVLPGVISSQRIITLPYLTVLNDGNTIGWYLADDLTTITKDGSNLVSAWRDKLGSGHDFANNGTAPHWSSTGILFAGTGGVLLTGNFTFNQPEFIYIVIKLFSDIPNFRVIFNGTGGANYGQIYVAGLTGTPNFTASAGTDLANSHVVVDNFSIIRLLFNGASSKTITNATTPSTGNTGTANPGGFVLGGRSGGGEGLAHIEVKELILRKVSDSSGDEALIYNYLKAKYGL